MNADLVVFGAGLLAGGMNALAGGGSFVSLPALISVGLPSVAANASSTVGLYPGVAASAWAYRDGLGPIGPVALKPLLLVTLLGGAIGAVLLLSTSSTLFDFLLPWLLLLATLTLAFGRRLGDAMRRRINIRPGAVVGIQFVLGVYGGYFGGAIGIMMTAVWSLLGAHDIKSLNAPRTLLVTAANTIAALIFAVAHAVRWRETCVLLIAATLGGYCGAQLGRRAPSPLVRAGTLLLAVCITFLFFMRTYGRAHP